MVTPVEIVSCFRFLGLQISDDLAWTHKTGAMLKKAHQRLYPLRCLRKCGISTQWLANFYRGPIESVLLGGVTVWNGNTTAQDRKATQRAIQSVRMVEKIIGCALPSIEEIFQTRCRRNGQLHQTGPPWTPTVLPSVVQSPVPQHWNQDKQVLSTGSAPTELLIAQLVDFWAIGLLDCYHTF